MAAFLDDNIYIPKAKSRKHITATSLLENEAREDVLLRSTHLRFTGKRITKMRLTHQNLQNNMIEIRLSLPRMLFLMEVVIFFCSC
jgi:hypothetical protein